MIVRAEHAQIRDYQTMINTVINMLSLHSNQWYKSLLSSENIHLQIYQIVTLNKIICFSFRFWRWIISRIQSIFKKKRCCSTCFIEWETLLTLTSSFLQGGALGVLSHLGLSVFGQLSQRVRLGLLVLFALTAVMAALRFPLPPLLLLPAWGRRLLSVVVEDILLLLEDGKEQLLMMNPRVTFVAL